jgi:tetratricopeptide (TPR) repeat protein
MEKQENIQGNLKVERLSSIIIALSFSKRTGTLIFKQDKVKKSIYMKEGSIIFAQSNDFNDRIDRVLMRVGLLSVEQNDEIERLFHQYGKITGKILVNHGFLTPQEFFASIRLQSLEIICSLFNWETGFFKFKESALMLQGLPPVKMYPGVIIYEGLRRMSNWNIIHKDMSDFNQIFVRPDKLPTLFHNVNLSKRETQILEIISKPKNIRDIIEESQMDSYSAMKSLYVLHSMCFLEKVDETCCEYGREEFQINSKSEDEQQAMKKKCDEFIANTEKLNYYQILGVSKDAPDSEIRKSYMSMIKDFHPDKHYQTPDKDFIQTLHSILLFLNKAYDVLKDKKKREDYDKKLEYEAHKSGTNNESLAYEHYQKGLDEFNSKEYWRAAEFFKIAARLSPHNAIYLTHLFFALAKIPRKLKEAEEVILKVIELEPRNSEHYLRLGQLYIRGRMKIRAKNAFEQALRLDPRNKEVREELNKLEGENL